MILLIIKIILIGLFLQNKCININLKHLVFSIRILTFGENMKNILFAILPLLINLFGFSQTGGISNSKLYSINTDAIAHHTVEFEPTVYHIWSSKYWDNKSKLQNSFASSDSVLKNTGLSFRFTYGLWDVFEIGGSIATDLASTSLGLKYNFWSAEKMGLAFMAGANIPLGNKTIDQSIRLSDQITSLGGGLIYTINFSDRFSLDANAQYYVFANETEDKNKGSFYLSTDVGYYFFDRGLQIITALNYASSRFEDFSSNILTFYPGITVETGNDYVIIVQTPLDIAGKNALKNAGLIFTLTMTVR
jgi:hypothetical protein